MPLRPDINILVPIALFGWIPFSLALFLMLPVRRAIIISLLGGWLFLPETGYWQPGVPEYTKAVACVIGAVLGAAIFDFKRLKSFRVSWVDVPMAVWLVCPVFSSLSNGLGVYDGVTEVLDQLLKWGLPYFLGRIYFDDLESVRELAVAVVIGGLIYVPFCLYEIRMSPQLHKMVYGFSPRQWAGTRLGGWRPSVFLEHGLALGIWMSTTSLVAIWLWLRSSLHRIGKVSMDWLVPLLSLTTVLCKSTAALGVLLFGITAIGATRWFRTGVLIAALILICPTYVVLRATGAWDGSHAVSLAQIITNEYRAQSLRFRFQNENALAAKALERPFFGWGGWGRSRVKDERGQDISKTDGLWIITLGRTGAVGLISLGTVFLLPVSIFWWRFRLEHWTESRLAPIVALSAVVLIVAVDNLLNAFVNPMFTLSLGALTASTVRLDQLLYAQPTELPRPRKTVRRLWPQPG